MIYTTYLSKLKDIPEDATKVCISRHAPLGTLNKFNCIHALSLAPSQSILDGYKENKDFGVFKKRFISEKKVVTIGENAEIAKILRLCKENDVYLICYEKDHLLCHRSIVAELISKKLGISWKEAEL